MAPASEHNGIRSVVLDNKLILDENHSYNKQLDQCVPKPQAADR